MAYNMDELQAMFAPHLAPVPATEQAQPKAEQASSSTDVLGSQISRLESRMERIETALNSILEHLRLPVVDVVNETKPTERDIAVATKAQVPDPTLTAPPDENRKYAYAPLDTTKSQFRILNVRRAEGMSDPLVAELITVGLDDNTVARLMYGITALSYTWGPPVFDGSILLDGCKFQITQSLEAALRQLRFQCKDVASIEINGKNWGQELYIWVDQICINQADLDERGEQVSLMRRIYKRATSIQVWLGEEADDSSLAIDLLNTLGAPPKHAPGEKSIKYPTFTEEEVMRHWSALRAFFKRPWWERVWIRQEIALSHMVKLYCGSKSFDMNHLDPALFMLSHIASLGYASTFAHSDNEMAVSLPWDFHANMLVELRKRTANGASWVDLAQLLRMTRSCKATDARDTVFSVLGLADSDVYGIEPNYRQGLHEILVGAVRTVIGVEHGLDILGVCQNSERKFGMPSWMPILTEKWRAMPFKTADGRGTRKMPCLTQSEMPNVRVSGSILEVQGDLVDAVEAICTTYVKQNADAEALELVYTSWQLYANNVAAQRRLTKEDFEFYVSGTDAEAMHWIRFLTVLQDEAVDLDPIYGQTYQDRKKPGDIDAFLDDPVHGGMYRHMQLNPRLSRCHLLPLSYAATSPHPNHRAHAGLQAYGVGRRLCVTSKGFLALIPVEARIGDWIALFKGASFPYVLRGSRGDANVVLVGEAFIPTWLRPITVGGQSKGAAEELMKRVSNADLRSWIRVC